MNNDDDFDKEYFEFVSSLGQQLFDDYLSELSRQKQKALLISAAIAILLSFTIVTPTEGDFAGLKFSFANVRVLPVLSGVVCLYFLLTYIMGVVQDWYRFKYEQMPMDYKLLKINTELVKQMNEKVEKMNQTYKAGMDIIEQRKTNLGNLQLSDGKDGLDELSAEREKILNDKSVLNKAKTLSGIINKYRWSQKVSVSIEIIFPIALGIFAVALAIWRTIF